jgi:hypothetical protein
MTARRSLTRALGCGLLVAGLLLPALQDAQAQAQPAVRLRGTITAVDGSALTVKSREGETLKLQLADNATVAVAQSIRFEDIKTGDYVGTTTRRRADGAMVAIEVHYLPPTAAAGQTPWDLEPETTMTNANVTASVSATGARELMLDFKGGTQKILVPETAALVRSVPGTRADLKVGEYVFAVVQKGADGTLTVPRVQVSKNGVKPPQ